MFAKLQDLYSRHRALVATILVVYALALAYIAFVDNGHYSKFGYPIHDGGDSQNYAQLAANLAQEHAFSRSTSTPFRPEMFRAPGYPLFLAPFYVFDRSLTVPILLHIVLLVASAYLILVMGKRFLPDPWPTIVAYAYVLDPATIFYTLTLLSDTLFIFLLLLITFLLFFREQELRWQTVAVCGAVLGYAALVRPAGMYLVAVVVFLLYWLLIREGWRKRVGLILVFLVAYAAILTPWYLRNFHVSGVFGHSTVGANVLLFNNVKQFLMNEEGVTEGEAMEEILDSLPTRRYEDHIDLAYSHVLMDRVKEVVWAHPFSYAFFHLKGSANLFLTSSVRDISLNLPLAEAGLQKIHMTGANETNIKELFKTNPPAAIWHSLLDEPLLTFERVVRLIILLSAVIGCVWGAWRKDTRFFVVLLALYIGYFALVTGPVSYPRYRLPLEPYLFMAAALGVVYLHQYWRGRERASVLGKR